jgi:uncharacterized protein (DUF1697 family)
MARHAAFLKGMNLGGRRITNEALRAAVEGVGLTEVETFRASGNLIFEAGQSGEEALRRLLEDGLRERLGYEVRTFVRSAAAIREIASARPFSASDLEGAGKLQVVLLAERPPAQARRDALALGSESDRLSFGERELFWLPAGGVSESPLSWGELAAAVGVTTVRTMGTIEQIAARWFAGPERA